MKSGSPRSPVVGAICGHQKRLNSPRSHKGWGATTGDLGEPEINVTSNNGYAQINTGASNVFVVMNGSGAIALGEGNNFIQITNDVVYSNSLEISAGWGTDVSSLSKTRGGVTITSYDKKDKISLASLAGVIVQQDGQLDSDPLG